MSIHLRDILFTPKSRQRVRLTLTVADLVGSGPTNLHDPWGPYYIAFTTANGIWLARSDHATPPMTTESRVTDQAADNYPSLRLEPGKRLWCVFERGGNTLAASSDDDGLTWNTPVSVITGGTKPRTATAPDGTQIIMARVAGALRAIRPTDETPTEFAVQRWNGAALVALTTEDEVHDISFGWQGDAPLLLVCKLTGSTAINHLASYDDGATFTEL